MDAQQKKKYNRIYYLRNKENWQDYKRTQRERMRKILSMHKSKCKLCGSKKMLAFHHRRNKLFTLSSLTRYARSKDKIIAEISKCDVLCKVCHDTTHRKYNYKSIRLDRRKGMSFRALRKKYGISSNGTVDHIIHGYKKG